MAVMTVRATDYTVTSDADSGTGTLRDLVAAAAAGDRVLVPEGMVVTLNTQLAPGTKSLDIVGLGKGATIKGAGSDRLLNYAGGFERSLGCYNLTFTNGVAGAGHGGVALIGYCKVVAFSNCVFAGNSAATSDGGVFRCTHGSTTIAATNSTFIGNSAINAGVASGTAAAGYWFGGCHFEGNSALTNGGVMSAQGPALFKNCSFTNNTAYKGSVIAVGTGGQTLEDCLVVDNRTTNEGGVAYLRNTFTMRRCTVLNNRGRTGGVFSKYNGPLELTDCLFEGNVDQPSVNWAYGGVLFNRGSGLTLISNCVFRANRCVNVNGDWGYGGVIGSYDANSTGLEVYDSTFDGNCADRGYGVMRLVHRALFRNCAFTRNSTVTGDVAVAAISVAVATNAVDFTNCTFYDNAAGTNAASGNRRGVIYITNTNDWVNLNHCTIVSNLTSDAAIYSSSTTTSMVSVANSVVAGNKTYAGTTDDLRGAIRTLANSAISEGETGFNKMADGTYTGNWFECGQAVLQLSPPAVNDSRVTHLDGSHPFTMAISKTSVLRDHASNTTGITTDARGFPRPDTATSLPDIGAYEYVEPPPSCTLLMVL